MAILLISNIIMLHPNRKAASSQHIPLLNHLCCFSTGRSANKKSSVKLFPNKPQLQTWQGTFWFPRVGVFGCMQSCKTQQISHFKHLRALPALVMRAGMQQLGNAEIDIFLLGKSFTTQHKQVNRTMTSRLNTWSGQRRVVWARSSSEQQRSCMAKQPICSTPCLKGHKTRDEHFCLRKKKNFFLKH